MVHILVHYVHRTASFCIGWVKGKYELIFLIVIYNLYIFFSKFNWKLKCRCNFRSPLWIVIFCTKKKSLTVFFTKFHSDSIYIPLRYTWFQDGPSLYWIGMNNTYKISMLRRIHFIYRIFFIIHTSSYYFYSISNKYFLLIGKKTINFWIYSS